MQSLFWSILGWCHIMKMHFLKQENGMIFFFLSSKQTQPISGTPENALATLAAGR